MSPSECCRGSAGKATGMKKKVKMKWFYLTILPKLDDVENSYCVINFRLLSYDLARVLPELC